MSAKFSFVIIGSGNIAWQMSKKLKKEKQQILQVYARKLASAKKLAAFHKCSYTSSLKKINKEADVYLFAISDDVIEEVADKLQYLNSNKSIFIHTSGSISSNIFENTFEKYAVLWPPQSINKEVKIDFSKVPLCITANKKALAAAKKVAKLLSSKRYLLDDEQKKRLHLAAVFANNFSNHMAAVAENICKENDLDFKILHPILKETFDKIIRVGPTAAQTGPASRADQKTMKQHEALLKEDFTLQKIYSLISKDIMDNHS